jgi:phosphoglycolate phosphatase
MIKLCIFDLDGTVLDTVSSIAHYANYALERHGIEPIDPKEYRYLAGGGIVSLMRGVLRYRGREGDEALYESLYRTYDDAYNADVAYLTTVFDGMRETLDELKRRGIKIAIVSNKPDYAAREVVERLYGKDYFDFVTGQTDAYPLKPDPSSVLAVAERFGAAKEEILYVGDTSTDMKTAGNAGLFAVGVLWGFRGRTELLESGADVLLSHPSELLGLI